MKAPLKLKDKVIFCNNHCKFGDSGIITDISFNKYGKIVDYTVKHSKEQVQYAAYPDQIRIKKEK